MPEVKVMRSKSRSTRVGMSADVARRSRNSPEGRPSGRGRGGSVAAMAPGIGPWPSPRHNGRTANRWRTEGGRSPTVRRRARMRTLRPPLRLAARRDGGPECTCRSPDVPLIGRGRSGGGARSSRGWSARRTPCAAVVVPAPRSDPLIDPTIPSHRGAPMPRLPRRPSRRRFLALLAAFAVVATTTTGIAPRARSASADSIADPNITVTASATTNLTDGQVMNVSVKPAAGVSVSVYAVSMKVCTDDVTVANAVERGPLRRLPELGRHRRQLRRARTAAPTAPRRSAPSRWAGTVTHTKNVGTPAEVTYNATCDPDHPCRLLVTGAMVTTVV